jgi:hypothetical protein
LPKSSALVFIDEVIFQRIPEDGGQDYTLDKSEKDNYFSRIGGAAEERSGTGTSFKIGARHIGADDGDKSIFSLTAHELKSIFLKVVSVSSPVNPAT